MENKKNKRKLAPGKNITYSTGDFHRQSHAESYLIYSLRDLVIYIIFLVLVVTVAFGSLSHAYNYYANVLSEVIINSEFNTTVGVVRKFKTIKRIPEIWLFIDEVLVKLFYTSKAEVYETQNEAYDRMKQENVEVLTENILIGVPRMRQLRVYEDTCTVIPFFSKFVNSCYDYYSEDKEDKRPFGAVNNTAWKYQQPSLHDSYYNGAVSSYNPGGFEMNFTKDSEFTKYWLEELKKNVWIRPGTRAVFIDFTLYTPNTNLFCVVKLVFELIPAGGVIPSSNFYTLKLIRHLTDWDYYILSCEILFMCFVIYYTFEEIHQIVVLKIFYFANWWNILDLVIVVISLVVISLGLLSYYTVKTTLSEKIDTIYSNEHSSFDNLARIQNAFNSLLAILIFVVWLKLLKFATLNKCVFFVLSTFDRIKLELMTMIIMMLAIVTGFAVLGNTLFGSHIPQFRTLHDSIFTLVGISIGGLYFYGECAREAPFSSPIFFGCYLFVVVVLFLNGFVALIVHGFHKAMNAMEDETERLYIEDLWMQVLLKLLQALRRNKLSEKIRERGMMKHYMKDYQALVSIARKKGVRGLDLALILKKHDIRRGSKLNIDQMSNVYNDLNVRNQLSSEVEEHDTIMEQIRKVNRTIEYLDQSLNDMTGKLDLLVNRVATVRR